MKLFIRTRGFTLIEMLVVIAVAIVLAAVGGFYLWGFNTNSQFDAQAREITALLQVAQGKSIGQENDSRWGVYVMNQSEGPDSYRLYQVDEDLLLQGGAGVPGIVLEQSDLPYFLEFFVPAAGTNMNIIFDRATGLPNASTSLIISKPGGGFNPIGVFISGNGRIEYRNSSIGSPTD